MQINQHFERKDPKNSMSTIIYRALQFETNLKPECVRKIAQKVIPAHASNIHIIGVVGKLTRFRVNLDDAKTSSFPVFLYEIMNWEGNSAHRN
jgi:hypothetical protein